MSDTIRTATTPDIGDTFTRDGSTYAVIGWLRRVKFEPLPAELADLFGELPAREPLLAFCPREQAEFVAGRGVCGLVVPVDEVAVTGTASWSDEVREQIRRTAQMLVGSYVR